MLKRAVLICVLAALLPTRAPALETDDLVALAAMPLAVAAVSEITDVPVSDLIDVVTLLNQAEVPAVQFVEVVRYTPALIVTDIEPDFGDVLRAQIAAGLRGPDLFPVIEQQFVAYDLPVVDLNAQQVVTVVDSPTFVPQVVTTRVATFRTHPHGGPPGQLKKAVGVQTGAEIVHPNRARARERVVASKPREAKVHRVKPERVKPQRVDRVVTQPKAHGNPHAGSGPAGNPGKGHGGGGGGGGKGHGKGKG